MASGGTWVSRVPEYGPGEGSETSSASLVSSGGGDTPVSQRIPTPRGSRAAEDGASTVGTGQGPSEDAPSPAAASITSGTGSFQSVPTVFSLQRSLNQRMVELKMQQELNHMAGQRLNALTWEVEQLKVDKETLQFKLVEEKQEQCCERLRLV